MTPRIADQVRAMHHNLNGRAYTNHSAMPFGTDEPSSTFLSFSPKRFLRAFLTHAITIPIVSLALTVIVGCVPAQKYKNTLSELEAARKTSKQNVVALESLKKQSSEEIENLQKEKAKISNELTAALTEARDKVKDLEGKLATEQVKVATLREEKQKLMTGTTTAQEEIAKIQKRVGELQTAANRAGDLEKRLKERDQEIGRLRQALVEREALVSKVAALTQDQTHLMTELRKQQEALREMKECATVAEVEALQEEKAKISNELKAALTESRDKAKDLEGKLATEQVKVARLREEKQKLMTGTTTAQEEIAKIQKRVGELQTAADRVDDLEKRLKERDQEIGKLRQALVEREALVSKVAALTQERTHLMKELQKQQDALRDQKAQLDMKECVTVSPEPEKKHQGN